MGDGTERYVRRDAGEVWLTETLKESEWTVIVEME